MRTLSISYIFCWSKRVLVLKSFFFFYCFTPGRKLAVEVPANSKQIFHSKTLIPFSVFHCIAIVSVILKNVQER